MKVSSLVFLGFSSLSLLWGAGCVHSHRAPQVVYTPLPPAPPPTVVVAPTSDRSAPQVYAPNSGSAAVVPPNASPPTSPPGIPTSDMAVADSVRQLLKSDNSDLSRVANNVQASVDHGVVTLRGTVPADHVRDEITMRVSKLPGVQHVHDELAVDFR